MNVGLGWDEARQVIQRLIDVAEERHLALEGPIVLVGGSALAAHAIRARSRDVDAYVPVVSDEAVLQVEREFRQRFGAGFRLDVTSTPNVWGDVLLRDIDASPSIARLTSSGGRSYEVRALSLDDLFILKLIADRARDRQDLPLLAPRTTPAQLTARFNALLPNIGNRSMLPQISDAFVAAMQDLFGEDPEVIIAGLEVTQELKEDLRAAHVEGEP